MASPVERLNFDEILPEVLKLSPFDQLIEDLKEEDEDGRRFLTEDYDPKEDLVVHEDDAGKAIQCDVIVTASSAERVQKAVQIAIKNGYGVMSIGAQTSAVGAFMARRQAQLNGLNGWLGIRLGASGRLKEMAEYGYTPTQGNEDVFVDEEGQAFKTISILNGKARILQSLDPENVPHRIQSWGDLPPKELDDALNDYKRELGGSYTVYLNLTTRNQAQIAAVVVTGAQGPNRANAKRNLKGVEFVNGKGEISRLRGDDAKGQVGLGGSAGAVTTVELELIKQEPYEFGFILPIAGNLEEALTKNFPKVMARLAAFCKGKSDEISLEGFEIITRGGMSRTHTFMEGKSSQGTAGSIGEMMESNGCKVGLMINGRTSMNSIDLKAYIAEMDPELDALLAFEGGGGLDDDQDESPNQMPSELKSMISEGLVRVADIDEYKIYEGKALKPFKEVREAVAESARDSKRRGPTTSTDLNIRITSENAQEIERAYQRVWEIYHKYIDDLDGENVEIYLYGHNFPNDGADGGGVDAHIRVTFPLQGDGAQERAAENVMKLSARKSQLYKELAALNGQDSIEVAPGEKGELLNKALIRKWEEEEPDRVIKMWKYMKDHGGVTFDRNSIKLHHYPARMEGGVKKYFTPDPESDPDSDLLNLLEKAILYWCQNDPSSPEVQKVFSEVHGLLRGRYDLEFNDRLFLQESPEKALHLAQLSLNDYKAGQTVLNTCDASWDGTIPEGTGTIITSNPDHLRGDIFDDYRVILYLEDSVNVDPDIRKKADITILSAQTFGTRSGAGIMLTNISAVQHARKLKKNGNNIGFDSIIKLNNNPHSTEGVSLRAAAELGCLLSDDIDQEVDWSSGDVENYFDRESGKVMLSPDSSHLHPSLIKGHAFIQNKAEELGSPDKVEARKSTVASVEGMLRKFLKIPDDYHVLFTGGSQAGLIEEVAQSLQLDRSVVVRGGVCGDRQFGVVKNATKSNTISTKMRWGTGLDSRLDSITEEITDNLGSGQESKGVYFIANEVSTGVQSNPSPVSKKLDGDVMKIVNGNYQMGAVPPDFENIDVYFGSLRHCLGLPEDLGVMIVSDRAMQRARKMKEIETQEIVPPVYRDFVDMEKEKENGNFDDLRSIIELGYVLSDYIRVGGVEDMARRTRQKMRLIKGVVDGSVYLEQAVVDDADLSDVTFNVVRRNRLVIDDVLRQLQDEHGIYIGEGEGPFIEESALIHLPLSVSVDQVAMAVNHLSGAASTSRKTGKDHPTISRKLPSVA